MISTLSRLLARISRTTRSLKSAVAESSSSEKQGVGGVAEQESEKCNKQIAEASHDSAGRVIFRASRIGSRAGSRQVAHRRSLHAKWKEFDAVNYNKMKSHVQILTTPSADVVGTTLLLHFDSKRYLIGSMGEGTQRAIISTGARLLKLSDCLITGRSEWRNTGGLLGTFLTLADTMAAQKASMALAEAEAARKRADRGADAPQKSRSTANVQSQDSSLTLFGPPNMNHLLATARRFVFRKGMPVQVHEIDERDTKRSQDDKWAPYISDECVKIWAMSILPSSRPDISEVSRPLSPRKRCIDELDSSGFSHSETDIANLNPTAMDKDVVKDVVNQMFSSNWHLDALHETRLGDVVLPATIFYRDTVNKRLEKYEGLLPGQEGVTEADLERIVLVRRPWPATLVETIPPTKVAPEAISYIIRNHRQRGKFNVKKAEALGITGVACRQLVNGNPVINDRNETILPEQIMDPDKEGGGFAVVDLPESTYIDALVKRPEWREPTVMAGVGAIVWICGPGVAGDTRLADFMAEFSGLKHVISSPEHCANDFNFKRAATSTARLHEIDPERFPDLVYCRPVRTMAQLKPQKELSTATSVQTKDSSEQGLHNHSEPSIETLSTILPHGDNDANENASAPRNPSKEPLPSTLAENAFIAEVGLRIQLEPSVKLFADEIEDAIDFENLKSALPESVVEAAAKARDAVAESRDDIDSWASSLPGVSRDAEIITLGTGSAVPSLYRNVSSTLIRLPGWGNILLDCGENTMGQIRRMFPPDQVSQILRELRIIWISHMHADHHLGTVGAIKAWYEETHQCHPSSHNTQPASFRPDTGLAVISDAEMQRWLVEYASVEDYGYSRIAPLSITPASPNDGISSTLRWFEIAKAPEDLVEVAAESLELLDIQAVPVQHCKGARAVAITCPGGFKVSYSGDCRPSQQFSVIGKDSTICIHEATFDDELKGDALAKKHSTTSEALQVADAMNARACLLTHFSQRYQKMPVIERGDGDNALAVLSIAEEPTQAEEEMEDEEVDDGIDNVRETDVSSAMPTDQKLGDSATIGYKVQNDMKVAVAFDYMRIKLGQFPEASHFTKAIGQLFYEEELQSQAETAANKLAMEELERAKKKEKMEKRAKFGQGKKAKQQEKQLKASAQKKAGERVANAEDVTASEAKIDVQATTVHHSDLLNGAVAVGGSNKALMSDAPTEFSNGNPAGQIVDSANDRPVVNKRIDRKQGSFTALPEDDSTTESSSRAAI